MRIEEVLKRKNPRCGILITFPSRCSAGPIITLAGFRRSCGSVRICMALESPSTSDQSGTVPWLCGNCADSGSADCGAGRTTHPCSARFGFGSGGMNGTGERSRGGSDPASTSYVGSTSSWCGRIWGRGRGKKDEEGKNWWQFLSAIEKNLGKVLVGQETIERETEKRQERCTGRVWT